MSDEKKNSKEQQATKSVAAKTALPSGQRSKAKAKAGGAEKGKKGPNIPPYLKLSSEYFTWKKTARALSERLSVFDMSISELGKAIADYSARGATFKIDQTVLKEYDLYEKARTAWEHFRDSFRSESDAGSVPIGVAAKLLAANNGSSAINKS